jgi:hypothetical protein
MKGVIMKHIEFLFDLLLFPLFFLNRFAFGERGEGIYKKGYRYHLAPLATVTVTINAGPLHVDNPSVCIESLATSKSSGLVSACFNADGVFTGGPGCQQVLKLRNLSDTPITRSDITVDYSKFIGILDNSCGIDGVDKTGSDCNISSSPDEIVYNPLGSFDAYKAHSVFVGVIAAGGSTSPFDGPITINYDQNGTSYTGTLKKCQVATEPAEDLCYDSVDQLKEGFGICMDFGFMSFGAATGGCGKQINLRNSSDDTIIDPVVSVITTSFFSGSMMDECGIDGTAGNCTQNDVFNGPFMGMNGLIWPRSITYDPMPDFDSNDTHSVYSLSTINMGVFPDTELIGQYIKDGKLYRGEIKPCDSIPNPLTFSLRSDVIDTHIGTNSSLALSYNESTDTTDQNGHIKYIRTMVAGSTQNIEGVHRDENGIATPFIDTTGKGFNYSIIPYLTDENCSKFEANIIDPDTNMQLVIDVPSGYHSATGTMTVPQGIRKKARMIMINVDPTILSEKGQKCILNSSQNGNFARISQCANSEIHYREAFGDEAWHRCAEDNGKPCKSNNHGIADPDDPTYNPLYHNELGCYMCTFNIQPSCSSDDFAIRPDHFDINSTNTDFPNLLRAGEEYNVSLVAYNADGNISADYNVSNVATSFEINTTKLFRDGAEDTSGLLHGRADINTSVAIWIVAGKSSSSSTEPTNAEEVIPVTYDDIGKVTLKIYDKNWSSVDNDDTPKDCNDSHAHTYICGEDANVTFIPHHFTVTGIHLHNHRDGNFTYLSNDLNMSAHVDVIISAVNAQGGVTENFRKDDTHQYYENPVSVDLNVTEWNSSIVPPNRHPLGNSVLKHDIPTAKLLGFGGSDTNGTHTIAWNDSNETQKIMLNYERHINQPVDPFDVNGTDINITVRSTYTDGSKEANITGSGIGDQKATFYYARVRPSRFFYDDVDSNSTKTPISVVVYSEDPTIMPSPQFKMTNEYDWYLNTDHQSSTDGSVNLVPTDSNGTVTTNPSITDGKNEDVTVTANAATRPLIVDINLTGTDPWLIYNPDADEEPAPFYRVRFIGASGWAGHGKTGNVVESNASKKKLRRLEW